MTRRQKCATATNKPPENDPSLPVTNMGAAELARQVRWIVAVLSSFPPTNESIKSKFNDRISAIITIIRTAAGRMGEGPGRGRAAKLDLFIWSSCHESAPRLQLSKQKAPAHANRGRKVPNHQN